MAIPITCPGCNAAFDVPENLVGKTIRCTTCKAQVTITAPLVAAAEPAKKGFGWAAKSGQTPPSEGEPLPESPRGDTVAPAKTQPGSAKPIRANKPAVKSDVEVDEDEDEDDEPESKPNPAKKAKIAAAAPPTKAANVKKRRNDDDDEDDDEDDDQPKRKKKKKKDEADGSGAKIAMIAGGVVALAAIVGLCIYLLSGEKKKDVAKTDTPVAAKAPETTPPNNPAPNVPVANWQPVTAGSLACEMPGGQTQRQEPGPAGVRRAILFLAPDKSHALFVFTVPLPANELEKGPAFLLNEAVTDFGKGEVLIKVLGLGPETQASVSSNTDIQQDGFVGKELQIAGKTGDTFGGMMRVVLVGKTVYIFGGRASNHVLHKSLIQRFMASVKITKTSDDMGTVAMGQPPKGPFPGPGQGPGPGPNGDPFRPPMPGVDPVKPPMPGPGGDPVPPIGVGQPPVGGEAVGKLAAKLNGTFFAGGFDTEKKELVVVGLRTAGARQAGTIQRYSYPDFKLVGTVNIPSVATRAQLDSAKGLLYVTTVGGGINPAALSFSQFDRSAYIGDVAVYDLAQLRSGKFDEKTELKPVATIQVGFLKNLIRDIALSRDGASLFVLTAPQVGKGKSQVLQVNTADRKTTKTVDLPNTGWEMVQSPDGQKLFISSMGLNAIVPPLMILDTGTMTLAPSFAPPKAVFNFAVSKDGRIVTSSLNANVGGVGLGNPGVGPIGPGGPVGPGPGGFPMGGVGGIGGIAVNPGDISVLDATGNKVDAFRPGTTGVSNNGYVEVTPDGKYLICSSHHPQLLGSGLDVYETSEKLIGEKKVASFKKAGEAQLGGTFLVSPDSEYIVFNNGAVLKLDDLGAGVGDNPGGIGNPPPPPGGVGMPPMGFPPKGMPPMGFPPKGPAPGGKGADEAEIKAVALIQKLKGTIGTDFNQPDRPIGMVGLTFTEVVDADLKVIVGFKSITALNLAATKVTDVGMKELAALKKVAKLDLSASNVTDAGMKDVGAIKTLTYLDLGLTKITDEGLKDLTALTNLKDLNLLGTQVTDKGVKELQKALPKCRIIN